MIKNEENQAEKMTENIILYDWITFTTKIHSISGVKELLGLENVEAWNYLPGRHGYRSMYEYEKICIMYDGHSEDMGICVDMSGKGCRAFETYGNGNYEALFDEILAEPADMNITRLDVAYDDHTGVLPLDKMFKDSRKSVMNYVSRFTKCKLEEEYDEDTLARTIYHGSKKSETRIRIYDKGQERGFTDKHWIRLELQLRRKNAESFIRIKEDIGVVFSGVVDNYVRYVKPSNNDSNKWRWDYAPYWKKFVGSAEKIKLYQKPGVEYNAEKLQNFVVCQAGNSINTYREIFGDEVLLSALNEHRKTAVLNEKQKRLIQELKPEKNNSGLNGSPDLRSIYAYIEMIEKIYDIDHDFMEIGSPEEYQFLVPLDDYGENAPDPVSGAKNGNDDS